MEKLGKTVVSNNSKISRKLQGKLRHPEAAFSSMPCRPEAAFS
jgi:hypothetical protein